MEIKITAIKQKSAYLKTDSTLGLIKEIAKEKLFPLFELMMKDLQNKQIKNRKRSIEL